MNFKKKKTGKKQQLEIVFMKHSAPNNTLVHKNDLTR